MRGSALSVLLLSACAPAAITLSNDLPELGSGKALVLAAIDPHNVVAMSSVDLSHGVEGVHFEAAFGAQRPARVDALVYDRSLVELGLAEGDLLAEGPRTVLGAPDRSFELAVTAGRSSGWASGEPLHVVLDQAVRAREIVCPRFFDPERIAVDAAANSDAAVAIALDPTHALISYSVDAVWLYTLGEGARRVPFHALGGAVDAAAAIGGGRAWLGGELGVARVSLSSSGALALEAVWTSTEPSHVRWLSARTSSVVYVLTLDAGQRVLRVIVDGASQALHAFLPARMFYADILTRAGEEAFAVSQTDQVVHVERDGASSRVSLESGGRALTALAEAPAVGLVAGGLDGAIFRRVSGSWEPLDTLHDPDGQSVGITTLAPYGPGFLAGGIGGRISYCEARCDCAFGALHPSNIRGIAVLGDTVLLAGTNEGAPTPSLTVLRRRP